MASARAPIPQAAEATQEDFDDTSAHTNDGLTVPYDDFGEPEDAAALVYVNAAYGFIVLIRPDEAGNLDGTRPLGLPLCSQRSKSELGRIDRFRPATADRHW